jgi:uncharacterized protein (DUF488 family)
MGEPSIVTKRRSPATGKASPSPQVFTIGYATRTPGELIDRVLAYGGSVIIDVRELPLSRRPGFSKNALAEAATAAGLGYEHVRALGNPKPSRELYKAGHVRAGVTAYRKHLNNGSRPALLALAERLNDERLCLLCLEDDPDECHRSVIVSALRGEVPGLAVTHL